jgi:hypothetical protein
MQPRLDAKKVPNQVRKAMMGLEETVHASGFESFSAGPDKTSGVPNQWLCSLH